MIETEYMDNSSKYKIVLKKEKEKIPVARLEQNEWSRWKSPILQKNRVSTELRPL